MPGKVNVFFFFAVFGWNIDDDEMFADLRKEVKELANLRVLFLSFC